MPVDSKKGERDWEYLHDFRPRCNIKSTRRQVTLGAERSRAAQFA